MSTTKPMKYLVLSTEYSVLGDGSSLGLKPISDPTSDL